MKTKTTLCLAQSTFDLLSLIFACCCLQVIFFLCIKPFFCELALCKTQSDWKRNA